MPNLLQDYPDNCKPTRMKKKVVAKIPAYKNPAAAAASRANDLLACRTQDEKAAQIIRVWLEKRRKLVDARGSFASSYL